MSQVDELQVRLRGTDELSPVFQKAGQSALDAWQQMSQVGPAVNAAGSIHQAFTAVIDGLHGLEKPAHVAVEAPDLDATRFQITSLRTDLHALQEEHNVPIVAQAEAALDQLEHLHHQVTQVTEQPATVPVHVETAPAQTQLTNLHSTITQTAQTAQEPHSFNLDTSEAQQHLGTLHSLMGAATSAAGGLVHGLGAIGLAKTGIEAITSGVEHLSNSLLGGNAEMEGYVTSFATLLGSESAAKQRMSELATYAAQTPFTLPEVAKASRVLQVFGGDALATGKSLTMVGDIASGTQQPFNDVAMWVGRAYDAMQSGRPWGEAAMRLQEMGAMSGVTRAHLEALQKEGKSGTQVWQEFQASMGQFDGMMVKQSQTFTGLTGTLSDDWAALQRTMTAPIFDAAKAGLKGLVGLLESDAAKHFADGVASGLTATFQVLKSAGDELHSRFQPLIDVLSGVAPPLRQVVSTGEEVVGVGRQLGDVLTPFQRSIADTVIIARAFATVLHGDLHFDPAGVEGYTAAFGRLPPALQTVARLFGAFLDVVSSAKSGLSSLLTTLQPVLPTIAGLAASFLLTGPAISAVGVALGLLTSPVALIVGGVVALGLAWQNNWGNIRSVAEPVITSLSTGLLGLGGALRVITGAAGQVAQALSTGGISAAFQTLSALVPSVLGTLAQGKISLVSTMLGWAQGIVGWIAPAAAQVVTGLIGFGQAVLSWAAGPGLTLIGGAVLGWGQSLVDWVAPALPGVVAQLGVWGGGIFDFIVGLIPVATQNLLNLAGQFVAWIVPMIPVAVAQIAVWGQQLLGWVLDTGIPAAAGLLVTLGQQFVTWIAPLVPLLGQALGSIGTTIFNFVLEASVQIGSHLLEWGQAFVSWVIPQIPILLGNLAAFATSALQWLYGTGLPALVSTMVQWGAQLIGWIGPALPGLLTNLGSFAVSAVTWLVTEGLPMLQEGASHFIPAIQDWAVQAASEILPKLTAFGNRITSFLTGAVPILARGAMNMGIGLVNGVIQGLNENGEKLMSGLMSLVNGGIDAINSVFGSSLPRLEAHFSKIGTLPMLAGAGFDALPLMADRAFQDMGDEMDAVTRRGRDFAVKLPAAVTPADPNLLGPTVAATDTGGANLLDTLKKTFADSLAAQQQAAAATDTTSKQTGNSLATHPADGAKKGAAGAKVDLEALTRTVITNLGAAAAGAEKEGATLSGVLSGLLDTIKPAQEAGWRDVSGSITRWLQQAKDGTAPPLTAIHDQLVGMLQKMVASTDSHTRIMAQAALDQLAKMEADAKDKGDKTEKHLDAATLKAQKSVVENLGKMAADAAGPSANLGDLLSGLFDLSAQTADAKLTGLHDRVVALIAQTSSDSAPSVAELRGTILGELDTLAKGSDQRMAAWAQGIQSNLALAEQKAATEAAKLRQSLVTDLGGALSDTAKGADDTASVLLKLQAVAQTAGQAGFSDLARNLTSAASAIEDGSAGVSSATTVLQSGLSGLATGTDQTLALLAQKALTAFGQIQVGLQRTVATDLSSALDSLGQKTTTAADQLLKLGTAADAADKAGMGDLAAQIRATASAFEAGAVTTDQASSVILEALQRLATAADRTTALTAQQAGEHFAQLQREATVQILQATDNVLAALGKLAEGTQSKTARIPQILTEVLALSKQASTAGMTSVADGMNHILDQAAAGTLPPMEQIYHTIVDLLSAAKTQGSTAAQTLAASLLGDLQHTAEGVDDKASQTAQSWADGMSRLVADTRDKSKSAIDVLAGMMPLAKQAADLGYGGLATSVEHYMALARSGTAIAMADMRQTIEEQLRAAAASGDASLALFAQNALAHMQEAAAAAEQTRVFKEEMAGLDTQIQAANSSLAPFNAAVEASRAGLDAANKQLQIAKDEASGYEAKIRSAQQALQDFSQAPLEGSQEFKEKLFANEQQATSLQYQLNQLKIAHAPTAQIKAMEKALADVQLAGEQIKLEEKLKLDPLRHQLENVANTSKELTFQEAMKGALEAKNSIGLYQQQLAVANTHVGEAEREQRRAQAAVDSATAAYKEQEKAIKSLVESLQAQKEALQQQMDDGGTPTGQNLAAGIGVGLQQSLPQAQAGVATFGQGLLSALRGTLGIASPSTQTQSDGQNLGAGLLLGFGQSMVGAPPAVAAALAPLRATMGAELQTFIPVWDSLFGPDAGQQGTLLNRLWGHQANSFFSVLVEYTHTKVSQWMTMVWAADLDILASRLTQYLVQKAGEVSAGGLEIGKQIDFGIAAGINANTHFVEAAARSAVEAAMQAAKDAAGIASPSRRAHEELGLPIIQGFANALGAGGPQLQAQMTGVIDAIFKGGASSGQAYAMLDAIFRGGTPPGAMGGSAAPGVAPAAAPPPVPADPGVTVHIAQVEVYAAPGMSAADARSLADAFGDGLEERLGDTQRLRQPRQMERAR